MITQKTFTKEQRRVMKAAVKKARAAGEYKVTHSIIPTYK